MTARLIAALLAWAMTTAAIAAYQAGQIAEGLPPLPFTHFVPPHP